MRTRHVVVASAGVLSLLMGGLLLPGSSGESAAGRPITAQLMAATRVARAADGGGYWLVTADGRVFAFGGAHLYGSMAGKHLKGPITGIVATADNHGYWLVGSDGGVFSFGDAQFSGSLGSNTPGAPVVGMASTKDTGKTSNGAAEQPGRQANVEPRDLLETPGPPAALERVARPVRTVRQARPDRPEQPARPAREQSKPSHTCSTPARKQCRSRLQSPSVKMAHSSG